MGKNGFFSKKLFWFVFAVIFVFWLVWSLTAKAQRSAPLAWGNIILWVIVIFLLIFWKKNKPRVEKILKG